MSTPDLAALLADPGRAEEVPAENVPEMVGRLELLKARLIKRATGTAAPAEPTEHMTDRLLDIGEAATLLRRSESWLRHHGRSLPGFHQNVPGGHVRWSKAALRRWISGLAS